VMMQIFMDKDSNFIAQASNSFSLQYLAIFITEKEYRLLTSV
jgi:hypothetical protein